MTTSKKPAVRLLMLAAVVAFLAAVIAAFVVIRSFTPRSTAPVAGKRAPDKVYAARGAIRMMASPGKPTSQLVIEHEPVNDFENADGTRGMASMSMPFMTGAAVSLAGLAVGDAVGFDLAVWYGRDGKTVDSYAITRIEKLPKGTELHFGAAAPTLGTPAGK